MSWPDPRVLRGTARMLAVREHVLTAGAEPLGWKAAFGAPSALAALDLDRPLVGFLTRDRLLVDGARVDVTGWTRPVLEAEVAAHLSTDLGAARTSAEALAGVGAWSVAIELADVDSPPDDIEQILTGNIYHRQVLLGPVVDHRPADLAFRILRDGAEVAATSDPEALTGELGGVLAAMATTLAHCGASLSAGDVVITGSVVPPIDVSGGGSWVVSASGLGEVGVLLA
ncbi:MAG: fumarylacetoacetate hydrolase family protein [Nocardioides sp.]